MSDINSGSSQSTEILIIGGGIAGTSTAYYLGQHGHEVILLERSEIASEASGLNAGTIWSTGWGNSPTLATTLSMGGWGIFQTLQLDLGYDIEFRQCGALKAIQSEEQYNFMQDEAQDLKSEGHHVELLTMRDARTIEPALNSDLLGCLYYHLGASANPVKTTQALASAAQQQGVQILTNRAVSAIEYLDNGSYKVVTNQGNFSTNMLVIAAGPWSRAIGIMLGLNIPIFAVRGQVWSTGPIPMRLFQNIGAAQSALHWNIYPYSDDTTPQELTHRDGVRLTRHLYGRQTRDGEIIIGGDRQINVAREPDPAGIEVNRNHAIEILPFLQEFPIKRTWSAWMPFTQNLQPIIGKIAHYENLYVLTGLCASGFEQGPMSGKLLADYIHSGEAPPILSEADPARQVTLLGIAK
jgi:glycine/D-amino acid oxidase-like deaminating enzyme